MSPLPPDDPITIPRWIMQWLVVPAAVGLVAIMRWLGTKVLQAREDRIEDLESEVEQLSGKMDKVLDEVSS